MASYIHRYMFETPFVVRWWSKKLHIYHASLAHSIQRITAGCHILINQIPVNKKKDRYDRNPSTLKEI